MGSSHYVCNTNNTSISWLFKIIVIVVVLVLRNSSQLAASRSTVQFLPGFKGPLPFVLETGYVAVDETLENGGGGEVFYYFIESENNPKEDPLLLWLTGGPGCSAFSGLIFEIGPLTFQNEVYNGSLPNLTLRPHSWTKLSSIIFVDLPVGTGFSYAKTKDAAQQTSWKMVHHAHQFLRKWLTDHSEFLSNEVYIAGDSYSGIPVPVIVQEISYANEGGLQPWINLKGYILGNPKTQATGDSNFQIPFNHGMGLISDELYESLQKTCRGDYQYLEQKDVLCQRDMQSYKETISGISDAHILEPNCESNLLNPMEVPTRKRSLIINKPPFSCRTYAYFLCAYWANDNNARKALHVLEGSVGEWKRCNYDIPFKHEILDSFPYHVNLSRKGYRSLIYSGDHDMLVPFLATQSWIRYLNYSIVNDWRQWYSNGQVAGYTRTYSNRMTFATIKGGGHTAPEYKPEECFGMFSRWISNVPL